MNDNYILDKMREQWKYFEENCLTDNILGLFHYGDKYFEKIFLIYIPTIQQLCLSKKTIEGEQTIDEQTIIILDIRDFKDKLIEKIYPYMNFLTTNNKIINEKYEEIFDIYFIQKLDLLTKKDITDGILAIFNKFFENCFKVSEKPIEYISKEDFFSKITLQEKAALYSIMRKIKNGEGSVSISNLIKENKISRPVYSNILIKMKENKIARVNNKGAGGTHITIINPYFKNLS